VVFNRFAAAHLYAVTLVCSRLAGCVHSSMNKPGANGGVGYESLAHCRLYCKVGHELSLHSPMIGTVVEVDGSLSLMMI